MPVCLSHSSAFEFYRGCGERGIDTSRLPKSGSIGDFSALHAFEALEDEGLSGMLALPVHVAVRERTHQRFQCGVVKHGVSVELPEPAAYKVSERLYVALPELCLVQMGAQASEVDLALLAYEFCGFYAVRTPKDGGVTVSSRGGKASRPLWGEEFACRKPLTTVRKAYRFARSVPGMHGVKSARKVLSYIQDGSISPVQTAMVLLLAGPTRIGGMGFEGAILNKLVPTREGERWVDIVWPQYGIGLELSDCASVAAYRSRLQRDRRRRMTKVDEVSVFAACSQDFTDLDRFDSLARNIARAMGKRVRISLRGHRQRQAVLRSRLLPMP